MARRERKQQGEAGAAPSARAFSALVMLAEAKMPDPDQLLQVLETRFAGLGPVSLAGGGQEEGLLALSVGEEGALVAVALEETPIPYDPRAASVHPQRAWDPAEAIGTHVAHLRVAVRWEAPEDPAEALAAARLHAGRVTTLAGVLARLAQAKAVHFPSSGMTLPEPEALRAAHTAMQGVSPLEAWVALYSLGHEDEPEDMPQGGYTVGLEPLAGREIELAPAPITHRKALDRLYGAAWMALDRDEPLAEGQELRNADDRVFARVYAVPAWLRSGVPAFVLVSEDAVVEGRRLRLKPGVDRAVLTHRLPPEPEAPAAPGPQEGEDDGARA